MSEIERIQDEVRRMTEGGAWHGPSLHQALEDVTASQAAARPIDDAHSIWEIVLHLTAWAGEVERRLREHARPLSGEADWPSTPSSDPEAWQRDREALYKSHQMLRQTIREFPPTRLDERVKQGEENDGSFYIMLHGFAQHDAYHTGQIAMLKKAIAALSDSARLNTQLSTLNTQHSASTRNTQLSTSTLSIQNPPP